nr:hypothetical protein [Kiritimatiellia bacterium]
MATYKFTLSTPDISQVIGADQVRNWSDIKPSYVVNDKYRGILREFTSTFEFVGDARRSIIRAFDKHGYDVDIFLTIDAGNDNGDNESYKQVAYRLRADIQNIEIGALFVSLNFIDSGFVANIMNREDMEINIELPDVDGNIQSVDGETVEAVDRLLWTATMHDRRLIFNSKYSRKETTITLDQSAEDMGASKSISFPADAKFFSGSAQETIPLMITDYVDIDDMPLTAIIPQVEFAEIGTIKIETKASFEFIQTSGATAFAIDYFVEIFNRYSLQRQADEGVLGETIREFERGTVSSFTGNRFINVDINYETDYELREGDSLCFMVVLLKRYQPTVWYCDTTVFKNNIQITSVSSALSSEADLILPHELFTQLLQKYTGQQVPFYSEFFGRTDLGYAENGPGAGTAIATGKMIRGFPYGENDNDTQTFVNTSFEKAFEAFNKIYNLAATVEMIGNERRIRIEPMNYFRNFEVIAELGENFNEVVRTIDTGKIYSDIQCGYKNMEYEELNGLYIFAGELGFSTPLNTEAESLNLVNEFISGGIPIELTRRRQYIDDPSKDYRFDENIFFVDCLIIEEGGSFAGNLFLWPKVNDGYDSVEGIFEPTRAYNLDLSPKRCFYNWQEEIKAGLSFKANQSLKYIKGPKNANLVSQKTGENEIVESGDVLISSLNNAKFIPEIFQISEAPFTMEQWDDTKNNRNGIISFIHKGVKIYCFIIS